MGIKRPQPYPYSLNAAVDLLLKTVRKGCLAFYVVDKESGFIDRLPFKKEIHVIDTDPSYVQEIFEEAVGLLRKDIPPLHSPDCQYGQWLKEVSKF
ncbi:MAG: hypothetical protein QME57_02490 [Patescibacteria group bacterium]|nr:hypothetical protein [Patescibacteria group bacterium]